MPIKLFAAASALALCVVVGNTQASQTWTVTTQGTISTGIDVTGVFGQAGQDLTGKSFTQSVTTSTDPAQWRNGDKDYAQFWDTINRSGQARVSYMDGAGPGFTAMLTVNGHSAEFSATATVYGAQVVGDNYSSIWQNQNVFIHNIHYGCTASGDCFSSKQVANGNFTDFVPSAEFNQTISANILMPLASASTSFYIYGNRAVNFEANVDYFTVTSVPEPETYAMLLGGLGLIGLLARRRKAQA